LEDLEEYELALSVHRPDACFVSALLGWGLDDMLARVEETLLGETASSATKREARRAG
jgi:hypothetical protein